jgi:hypothetical protein
MLFYGVWFIFQVCKRLVILLGDHLNFYNSFVKNKHQLNFYICTNNFDYPKTFMKTQKQGFLSL